MSEAVGVDDASLWSVEADDSAGADVEPVPDEDTTAERPFPGLLRSFLLGELPIWKFRSWNYH